MIMTMNVTCNNLKDVTDISKIIFLIILLYIYLYIFFFISCRSYWDDVLLAFYLNHKCSE